MQCRRCKKIFSYEKTEGICPKCAAYNRPGGELDTDLIDKKYNMEFGQEIYRMNEVHQDLHKKYDNGKDVHKTRADIYQEKEQPYKNNLAKGILAGGIILFIVFGVAGVAAFYSMKSQTEVNTDRTIEVIQADEGSAIDIGGQLASFSAARVIETEQIAGMLPEGKKLVAVEEQLEISDIWDADSYYYTDPYIAADGLFLMPLKYYDVKDYLPGINVMNDAFASYEGQYDGIQQGVLLYIADEDLEQITLRVPDWGGTGQEKTPVRIYQIELQIEEGR